MTKQGLSSWVEVRSPNQQQESQNQVIATRDSPPKTSFTVHTSLLFDPHQKKWLKDAAVEVDKKSGLITSVTENVTSSAVVTDNDIDLRGYTVVPGFGKCCDSGDLVKAVQCCSDFGGRLVALWVDH
jgi:Ni,Fe-hydrogenase III component G